MNGLRVTAIPALLALCACAHDIGPQLDEFRPAQAAAGINAEILLRKGYIPGNHLKGEILAVSDDGLLILLDMPLHLTHGRWRFIEPTFRMMRSIDLGKAGKSSVKSEGQAMDDARLKRLRLLSRYPQGLSDELRTQLLANYGESAVYIPGKD